MAVSLPSPPTLLTVGLSLVGAGATAWLAVRLYHRQHDSGATAYMDLVRPYIGCCVVFSLGILGIGLAQTVVSSESAMLFALLLVMLPSWMVFGCSFAGRDQFLTRRRIYVGVVLCWLLALFVLAGAAGLLGESGTPTTLRLLVSSLSLVFLAGVFTVSGFVLLSAYRHRSISMVHGAVAILPVVWLIFGAQVTRPSTPVLNDAVVGAVSLLTAGTFVVGTTRYDIITKRPGTGSAGERMAIREMDEATVTVEPDGSVARANPAATALFGDQLGEHGLGDVLGYEIPNLAKQESIECWTTEGQKQFDPRVSELTTQHGEVFGYTVILIDITDREMQRQRIEVLNRILRHNIRNRVDVIKADAETLDDEARAASIIATTEHLERLSGDARRIETLLRRSQEDRVTAELRRVVGSVAEGIADEYPSASISLDLGDPSITVDAELCRFAFANIVENAVVHNDDARPRVEISSTETDAGTQVTVADDGPGIPDTERAAIEQQTESPLKHASSLGLWGTNWAVQQLGGDLSFRESDLGGTAVVIELPTHT